ncbi:MAG: FABP family protein [Acidimicrobiia bacterium]|nr:FABP family protein [Acidimicrobiia bacterium]
MGMHPDLEPLTFLVGTWHGWGHGEYPTIEDFDYEEEISFIPGPGKPFLAYAQHTRNTHSGDPLHSETGYLRPSGSGRVEMVLAQPSGLVEVHTGSLEGQHLHLRSVVVEGTPTAKDVSDVERHIEVEGDHLSYRLALAGVGHGLTTHLVAELTRR